jgi:hypothetical protein
MKIIKWSFGILALLPIVLEIGYRLGPDIGMVYLLIENVLYLPFFWIGEPFFEYTKDIGGYLANTLGRIVVSLTFGTAWMAVKRLTDKSNVNKKIL